jgi:hypothetical protein
MNSENVKLTVRMNGIIQDLENYHHTFNPEWLMAPLFTEIISDGEASELTKTIKELIMNSTMRIDDFKKTFQNLENFNFIIKSYDNTNDFKDVPLHNLNCFTEVESEIKKIIPPNLKKEFDNLGKCLVESIYSKLESIKKGLTIWTITLIGNQFIISSYEHGGLSMSGLSGKVFVFGGTLTMKYIQLHEQLRILEPSEIK